MVFFFGLVHFSIQVKKMEHFSDSNGVLNSSNLFLNWQIELITQKKEVYSQQIDLCESCLFIPCAMIDIGLINREDR